MPFEATWMDLESVILNEVSQTEMIGHNSNVAIAFLLSFGFPQSSLFTYLRKETYTLNSFVYSFTECNTKKVWNQYLLNGGSAGKESSCSARNVVSIPGLERSPWEGNDYPLQYSNLKNSMDYIVHGFSKSQTRLSDFHNELLSLCQSMFCVEIIQSCPEFKLWSKVACCWFPTFIHFFPTVTQLLALVKL